MPIAEQTFGELLSLGHTTKLLALRLQLLLEQLDPLTQGFQLRSNPTASLESPNSAQSQVPGTSESCQKEERPNQDKDKWENLRHVLKGIDVGRLVNRNASFADWRVLAAMCSSTRYRCAGNAPAGARCTKVSRDARARDAAAYTTACPAEFHRPPGIFAPGRPNEQERLLN
jgi:hypothetical protein